MLEPLELEAVVPESAHASRLDAALAQMFPAYSRSTLAQWVKQGWASVDGEVVTKPRMAVSQDQKIAISGTLEAHRDIEPEAMDLDVIYEDDVLMIVNKPAGLVVHPADSVPSGTLVNGLLAYNPDLAVLPRAGLIHRIDKDTTGLLVIAKTLEVHHLLTKQLKFKKMTRQYLALVQGHPTAGGTVNAPIGRHPNNRLAMAVVKDGKPAVTHFRIAERLPEHTLLAVQLETGRTHQIRVHMRHLGYPIVGDPLYGDARFIQPKPLSIQRQALHAARLKLIHPATNEIMSFEAPLPKDFEILLAEVR